MTRLPQGAAPSLRATVARELGLELEDATRDAVDRVEAECRARVSALQSRGWREPGDDPTLAFAANRLVPAIERATDEITNLLHGLDGKLSAIAEGGVEIAVRSEVQVVRVTQSPAAGGDKDTDKVPRGAVKAQDVARHARATEARRVPVNPRLNTERFKPAKAKHVRFFITETNSGSEPCIDELEVFSTGPKPVNVALASR